ncbi:MAG: zinc-binding dehydrogenase [Lachnospirales bacterium]
MDKMKSLVMVEQGKIGWIEKDVPEISEVDVLIKPVVVAMCSSDVHSVKLGAVNPTMALGHEAIGEIVKVGSKVQDFNVGDKVIIPSTCPRWDTLEAQNGVHQHSEGMFGGIRFSSKQDGCFSDYFVGIQADMNLCKVPEEMDLKSALMTVDMVTTGFQGVDMADIKFGDTVVVVGIGPVGLMSVAGARFAGAGRIIAVGTRPNCVELAKEYGANDIVSYKEGDIVDQILALTNGKGADKCIVAGGGPEVIGQAVAMIRPGGNVSNVNYFESMEITIPSWQWGMGMAQKTIYGGLCAGGRVRMEALCQMLKYSGVNPGKMVTHEFHGFDKLEEAFQLMTDKPRDLIKPIVYYK